MFNLQASRSLARCLTAALLATGLTACGNDDDPEPSALPQLSPATPAAFSGSCSALAGKLTALANTSITGSTLIAAGTLTVAGKPVPEHCQVVGRMFPRTSTVDGQSYAIGFEMRLPTQWNGRFFYQANGGTDGVVSNATGSVSAGPGLSNPLAMGYAVLSSDAGHGAAQNPTFGIDPQARLDYGYQAVGKLTPMAKSLIQTAYGRAPDRSYLGGCSNGGRHALVAASRYADQYDGILSGDPGWRLPLAAVANVAGYQTYASLASNPADVSTGFTVAERQLVSNAVAAKCDALDGATDGIVQDTKACQAAFDLNRDVPTCTGARDGSCLTSAQKTGIARLFAGAVTSTGTKFYSSFPYDTGLATTNWGATWKFGAPTTRDAGAIAYIWQVPPASATGFNGTTFAATSSIDSLLNKIQATDATYTESALSFMLPPRPTDLSTLKNRGAKLMVYHGTSDPIFSSDDSVAYIEGLATAGGDASSYARLYLVPGMNHCGSGPSTDQFDMLTALVAWVETGKAPDSVLATARGTGNAAGANADVPAAWASNRTRPLCPYPKVARYNGSGSVELAESFSCK